MSLFAYDISGSHFNPAITLSLMFRRDSPFGEGTNHRMLGLLYILAQILGAISTSLLCDFIIDHDLKLIVSPIPDYNNEPKEFAALISEIIGTFIMITLFMLCIDPHTRYSKDRVIITFCLSSSYIGARLMAGGSLITGVKNPEYGYNPTGPLLNPGLAFGQMLVAWEFEYWLIYLAGPIIAAVLSCVFYEYIFLRSIEYLNEMADVSEDHSEISMDERKPKDNM